jgi:predicted ATPase/class 3 adenylate cyclase
MAEIRANRPSGVVTFLFTDIEGSSRLWDAHPDAMRTALERHDEIVRDAIEHHGGYIFTLAGDGFAAAFQQPVGAIDAARQIQLALASQEWPPEVDIRVRVGVHTGSASERDGDYFGPDVNRAARLMSAGHGGQVLVSGATEVLVRDASFADLGLHRLRDLSAPEQIFQLVDEGLERDFPALDTLNVRRTNLPIRLDTFHGREHDLDLLLHTVKTRGCATITGPGGAGKTTLAQQLAARLAGSYPGGTWLVELAPVIDPAAVPYQIADEIDAPIKRGRPVLESVADHLGDEPTVLILDNCEHVLDAARQAVVSLEAACPDLAIIATSRGPLGVPGERVHVLGPLDCSRVDSDAVEMLAQRFREANIAIDLGAGRRHVLLKICQELDGLPLAIELAAARGRSMTPEDIATRLDERLRLLRSRSRTADRHSTLRSTIEWSYQMLEPTEQLLLARLGVFTGWFDAVAVERICCDERVDEFEVIDLLSMLVEQSMVVVELGRERASYRLLHTIRDFALEELGDDTAELRDRHAAYYAELVEELADRAQTSDEVEAVTALEAAWEDVRAAAGHAVERGDREVSLRLLGSLVFEVLFRSRGEVWEWLEPALQLHRDELDGRSVALRVLEVTCAAVNGDNDAVLRAGEAYAEVARVHPELTTATDMSVVGLSVHLAGEAERAHELYELALQQDDPRHGRRSRMWAHTLTSLLYAYTGRLDQAREEADLARELLDETSAISQVVGLELVDALRGEEPPEVIADRMAHAVDRATEARSWLIRNVAEMVGAGARAELGELPRAMEDAAVTLARHRSSGALAVVSQQLRRSAVLLMDAGRYRSAALVLDFVAFQRTPAPNPHTAEQLAAHEAGLATIPTDERERIAATARGMTLEQIIDATIDDLRSASSHPVPS